MGEGRQGYEQLDETALVNRGEGAGATGVCPQMTQGAEERGLWAKPRAASCVGQWEGAGRMGRRRGQEGGGQAGSHWSFSEDSFPGLVRGQEADSRRSDHQP